MKTYDSPLAAYCYVGGTYERFRSSESLIATDVQQLLQRFGASEEVRAKLKELFESNAISFADGLSYQSTSDQKDPSRTVVYACFPISPVDDKLVPIQEEEGKEVSATSPLAWRRSA